MERGDTITPLNLLIRLPFAGHQRGPYGKIRLQKGREAKVS